ncbi:GyrI-like domain-containing protein [Candidatus Rariloculus sp.]|uniref:GyrI-like domain-containing protein n=1 Tax=Candidatus Rariloculus sp. TaxID=3101265 RepID=UPI003D0F940D
MGRRARDAAAIVQAYCGDHAYLDHHRKNTRSPTDPFHPPRGRQGRDRRRHRLLARRCGSALSGAGPYVRRTAVHSLHGIRPRRIHDRSRCTACGARGRCGRDRGGFAAGRRAVFALREGDYAELEHTYKALEQWAQSNGRQFSGPCWESYVTDPGEHPNPADWRTEVYWPIAGQDEADRLHR